MSGYDYRPFLPPPGTAKIAGPTPRAHTEARTKNNPRAQGLLLNWQKMLDGPFRGITTDSHVIPDLYAPRPEGAPTLAMIEAVNALLAIMSPEQRKRSSFPVDSTTGGAGRTPSFASRTTACASTRSASRCARR